MKIVCFAVLAASVASGSVAVAQVQQSTPTVQNRDANRIICRSEESTGSRLASKKRCMPASEWAEQRRLDREIIERAQAQRAKN